MPVTVYNKTGEKLYFFYHGEAIEIPGSGGDIVGQIVTSEKRADAYLKMHGPDILTLNRGDLANAVNVDIDSSRREIARLVEENQKLSKEIEDLKARLQTATEDLAKAKTKKSRKEE